MFKLMFPAFLCLAFACPMMVQAQDCGCAEPDPCQKTRKKLALVDVSREVCRLKRVCEVDACGCPTSKLTRVKECVTRKKLTLVDVPVDPCKPKLFGRLCDKLSGLGCGCKNECDPCDTGCDSGCGCEGAAYPAGATHIHEGYSEVPSHGAPVESVIEGN